MKKFILWSLAFVITISAAFYQRMTGPTYPKGLNISVNNTPQELKLVRSLSLNEKSEVKLGIADPTIRARLFFKQFRSEEEYQVADFALQGRSKISREFFAAVPQQPAAGKVTVLH